MLINLNWTDCWSNWPFASKSEEQTEKTERRLRRATMVAHLISPLVAAAFAVVYWVIGMYNVMYPDTQWEFERFQWIFSSIFNISNFLFFVLHFASAVRVFELQSSICMEWRERRLSWFSWLQQTSVLRPSAESSKAWSKDTNTNTETFF